LSDTSVSASRNVGGGPTLTERTTERPRRCRCGTSVPAGGRVLELEGLSDTVAPFFRGRYFCSEQCARAEFLETFETLDAMVGSSERSMITDLRQAYAELGRAFAALLM